MAAFSFVFSLSYCFTLLTLSVHGSPSLISSDGDALLLLHNGLAGGQHNAGLRDPCESAGIFCGRRPGNVLRVTRIVYGSEGLSGTLSPAISRLSELKELSLHDNKLSGQIPAHILNCRKMEILNLRGNQFSGEVPLKLSSLARLRILDLSSNKLSGNLNFLQNFPNLEKLSLSDNLFTGKVPQSLNSFRNLRFLNISGNSLLKGPVPVMGHVDYRSVSEDLSDNTAPKRFIFAEMKNKTSLSLIPNGSAPHAGKAQGSTPRSSTAEAVKNHNKSKRKLRRWIIGFSAGALAGTLSGLFFSVLFKAILFLINGSEKHSKLTIFSPLIKKAEDLAFLQKEDGLSSLEMIGKGGCGEVYKAELPGSDGKMIAIKKIIQPAKDAAELKKEDSKAMSKKMRQIKSEVQILGQIRHRNLLPLLAHMPRRDCHYLVYEFMRNGSLHDALQDVSNGKRELDWLSRHRIAVGIASGLEYLHINHTQRIIHRDLKPANVLIDDDMQARIADFGLAKAVPDAHTHITTSNVAGTVGYIAPEYHQMLKFTDKCDIYSFGVLLAVLVVGKLPSDEFFQTTEEVSIVKWLRMVMSSGDPREAIDDKLLGNGYEEQMILVLKIACFCTLDNPKERPNSKDVRCMLTQIEH
ncbi:unnamed protein product [Cuscuta epithymum]|uniref:Protein kinase domain-containing protein n=1 Tax=Cuscuta epithymum TaxID=186058 RepID=A0AAV0EQM0_9ASTE|nr:unnamed protein product [Cuscuta epithymum]